MSSVTGLHLETARARHSYHKQTLVVLSSSSGSCLWVLPLGLASGAANAPEVVRSLRRRKPGEMLAGMTQNPNVLRGSLLAHPILLVGSSLIPPGGMSNTDCSLALLWLPTAAGSPLFAA